jgi:hypothetical protein
MVQVFMSREDYENFDLPSRSTESFFSLEAVPGEPAEPGDNTTGEGDPEKMKKLEAMQKKDEEGFARKLADANLQQKKFKHKVKVLWSRVTGKSGFYKKYMGRIDGLFKQFGTEAKLNENQMRGDPVQILQNDAFEFMKQLIVGLEKLHNDTMMIAKKSASSLTAEGQLKAVEAFIGKPISDPVVQKDMGKAFFRAFIKRIGLLLFKDNPVYGYTVDSVVENMKLPPANHVIVSLFVPNPESQPQERSVSDIFATPDSFKIMGDINKVPIYNIAGLSAEAIAKLGQLTDIKLLADAKKNAIKNMREDQNGPKDDLTRQYIRMANSLWKGIERSVDYFVKLKNYITWCCDVYANMVDRIDKLCRHAIVAMLYLENNSKDSRYNTGHGNASKIMISRNAQATDKKGSAQNWTHGKDHTTTGSIHKALNTSTHLKKVGIQTQDQHDRNVTGTKYNKKTNRFETT